MATRSIIGWLTYTVRRGDSLTAIAGSRCGGATRWADIADGNGLKPPYRIFVGQRLMIPPPAAAGSASAPAMARPTPTPTPVPCPTPMPTPTPSVGRSIVPPAAGVSAAEVCHPPFTQKVEVASLVTTGPNYVVESTIKCDGAIALCGVIRDEIAVSTNAIDLKYKQPALNQFHRILTTSKMSYDFGKKSVSMQLGLSAEVKAGDKTLATADLKILAPNQFEFSYKPQKVAFANRDVAFNGQLSYACKVTVKPDDRRSTPGSVPYEVPSGVTATVLGGLAMLAMGAIVIASLPAAVPFATAAVAIGAVGLTFGHSPYTRRDNSL